MPVKKNILKGKTEGQAWRIHGKSCCSFPAEWTNTIAAAAGVTICQANLMMKTLSVVFVKELEQKSSIFIPGIGTFQANYYPPVPGYMKLVFGKFKAVKPEPSHTAVHFTPFHEVEELLSASKRVLESLPAPIGSTSSGSSPPSSAKPSDLHRAPWTPESMMVAAALKQERFLSKHPVFMGISRGPCISKSA